MPLSPDQLTDALLDLRALRDACALSGVPFSANLVTLGQYLRDEVAALQAARQTPDPATQLLLGHPVPAGINTVADARTRIAAGWEDGDGTTCPVCTQLVKLYRRKLNSGMARILIWLVREAANYPEGWVPVADTAPTFVRRSNEVSRLALWGLVEDQPSDTPARRNSGVWRPTDNGRRFALRTLRVPSHVLIFNNVIYGWSAEQIDIDGALGEAFRYDELMAGRFDPGGVPAETADA